MKTNKKLKNTFLKAALVILLSFIVSFSPLGARKSHAWLSFAAAQYKQMLEEISYKIKGITLGLLKQQAVKSLNSKTDKLVAGKNGKDAKFITDWESYLYKTPDANTKKYMNDYLSKITAGKGSKTTYKSKTSEGFFGGSSGSTSGSKVGGGSYSSQLIEIAKKTTSDTKDPKMTYEGDPSQMFASGNFKNMNLFLSGINNPWAFQMNAQREYEKKKAEERKLADTKSKAYFGFIGTGEGQNGKGKITRPGSLTMQSKANAEDLGNKVIASATHPEEIITALVSQLITKSIGQGMGSLPSIFQKELGSLTGNATKTSKSNDSSSGPGSSYKNSDCPLSKILDR